MPTVHLVRHGEVANPNHVVYADLPGFDLSDLGVRQAHRAAAHLAAVPVDMVLTSPLARARATAMAIATAHGLTPQPEPGLTETRQYPGWTGLRWAEVEERFGWQLAAYLADASDLADAAETLQAVARRVCAVIDAAAARADAVVVVGHQDPLQAARLVMTGRPLSELLLDPPSHASVVTLEGHAGQWVECGRWRPTTG